MPTSLPSWPARAKVASRTVPHTTAAGTERLDLVVMSPKATKPHERPRTLRRQHRGFRQQTRQSTTARSPRVRTKGAGDDRPDRPGDLRVLVDVAEEMRSWPGLKFVPVAYLIVECPGRGPCRTGRGGGDGRNGAVLDRLAFLAVRSELVATTRLH